MYKNLTTICAVAALALGLAACGGGGSDETADMGGGEMCPEGQVGTPPNCMMPEPPGPTAESLKADAADAITAAQAAGMAADQAMKDAIKYAGMLSAENVDGESATAVANAQKVLDAEMAASQAVMDADDALKDAEAALTKAEALPADDAERDGAIAAANEAIKQATAEKKAAQEIIDEAVDAADGIQSLKEAVQMVKGANPLADGYPKMPAGHGKDVATSVKTALGSITRVNTLATLIPDPDPDNAVRMHDGSDIDAMTWAMIVGEDNVKMERIGDANAALPVASIAGMAASAVDKTDTRVLTSTGGTNGTYPDGVVQGTATVVGGTAGTEYKGIPGAIWCLKAGGCKVTGDGDAAKLGDGWYFTPANKDELYIAGTGANAGTYVIATLYARYGYWLTFTDGNASGITIGAAQGHPTTLTTGLNLIRPASATADVTARYTGDAAGISARGDTSGHFTATVNLTAKFGAAVTDSGLSGTISGFDGAAANSGWVVTLNETALNASATFDANGTAYGGAAAGEWTAQGYGPAAVDHDGDSTTDPQPQRPEGFFGTFNANFTDGMAAGAYATRKQE